MKKLLIIFLILSCSCTVIQAQVQHLSFEDPINQDEITVTGSITLKNGFSVSAGANFRAYITPVGGNCQQSLYTANKNFNYVITHNVRKPGIVNPSDSTNLVCQVNTVIDYIDGQGRSAGSISVKASPSLSSVLQMKEYNDLGLEKTQYLPYTKAGELGFYRPNITDITSFYTNQANVVHTPYPIAESIYEPSPLKRLEEQGAAGDHWQLSTSNSPNKGHTIAYMEDDHRREALYRVTINNTTGARTLTRTGNNALYPIDALTRIVTRDENNSNTSAYPGKMLECKDKEGRVILKRTYNLTGSVVDTLSTYYVYDDFGNLSFVLPPKAEPDNDAAISQTTLDNLCYQYKYDGRQRQIAKKVPGKGWEFMVYDKRNQLILTQDANQRSKAPQEWTVQKYDLFGRQILQGVYVHPGSTAGVDNLNAVQTLANGVSNYWETRVTTGNGYTNVAFPTTLKSTLLINYYDDYNLPGGNPYPYADGSVMTRGLLTASKKNVLGAADMLWAVNYYDNEGRVIKTFNQHYKGSTFLANNYDETTNTYDFVGSVLTSNRSHKVSGVEQVKILTEFEYDHLGRNTNTWQTINANARILQSKLEYNELGQLFKKNLHSTNNGVKFLQTITYAYNERGWLINANAPELDVKLRYQIPTKSAVAQYNGNISEFEYTTKKTGNRWFTYSYDKLNRLTNSVYSTANELNETIAYDKAGNITSLKRGVAASIPIAYTYANAGLSNQLLSVSGGRTGSFTYDVNGNAISDGTRSITAITYNQFNLPLAVTGSQTASYLYDATGTKLKSVQGAITREYIGGIHYKNNVLDFISTDEGRAVRNTDGTYRYEYNLKDNLGNVRISIDDSTGVARVIQEDEYYAFGLNSPKKVSGDKSNYLYNGKEEQDVLTDEYDYGARFYDPVIGRWNVIDPLAEVGRRWSPYTYAFSNPIRFLDPDGMWPDEGDGPDELTGVQTGAAIAGLIRDGIHGVRNLLAAAGDALGINETAPGMKWESVDRAGGIMGFGMAQVPSQGALDAFGHIGDGLNALALNSLASRGKDGILMSTNGQESRAASQTLKASGDGALVRFGTGPESMLKLSEQAKQAEAAGFPHGVSTKLVTKPSSSDLAHKVASKSEVEKVFKVKQTGKNKSHHTVILPKPVTQKVTDQFNNIFK